MYALIFIITIILIHNELIIMHSTSIIITFKALSLILLSNIIDILNFFNLKVLTLNYKAHHMYEKVDIISYRIRLVVNSILLTKFSSYILFF